jgi:uncharacterized membrane protein YkoI
VTRFVAIDRTAYDTWRMRRTLTLLILVAAAWLTQPVSAMSLEDELKSQHVQYQGEDHLYVVQSDGMSLSQAIESVRSRTGGKVVGAETRVQGGREVHHIKVLTKDGKVKTHKVNGRRR